MGSGMAIDTTDSFSGPYLTNGATTVFPFTFKALGTADISVTLDGAEVDSADYSVAINPGSGGSISFFVAPAAGQELFVLLDPVFTQPISFENGSAWLAEPVNETADRAAQRDIWLRDRILRGVLLPRGEVGQELPSAADRAGKFLAFDGAGALAAVVGALAVPALAVNIATDGGGNVQALLNSSLQADRHFNSVVTVAPGELAAWVLTTTPTPGQARDGILIYHTMDDPSNGLHVLGYANSGCVGGQAGGFAMDGPGTGSAAQCNRRGSGTGNGVNGNRVDDGDGYGVSGQFSSLGTGAGVQAIKQNSGVTGTAGTGPALLVENSSNEGHAIDSATALVNTTDTSHRFTRLQREGINADFRMSNAGARGGPTSVVRAVLAPGEASTGAGAVNAFEAIIGANITGSAEVNGFAAVNDSAGNAVAHGVIGLARGANTTNYGGRFGASGAANNIALRVDGQSWLLGNIQGSLPEYANDAAASATLAVGYWYINSTTGAVTSRRV